MQRANSVQLHRSASISKLVREGAYKDSAGKKHCTQEFEAIWYKNQGKYIYQFCARPVEELEEDGEIRVLAISRMSL